MKLLKQIGTLTLLTITFSACSMIDASFDPVADTTMLETSGTWQVSYFFDQDKEETSDFSGYTFSFDDNEVFKAVSPAGTEFIGTWRRTTDDGLPRLLISISGNENLDELSDDWVLEVLTDKQIELRDDNETEVEQLHFSRQ